MAERPVMYLEYGDWSPRYQDTFYTVRLRHFELCNSPPTAADDTATTARVPKTTLGGKTNFPAYYYKVEVFCGRRDPRAVFRRYSQFKWLYEKLTRNTIAGGKNSGGSGTNHDFDDSSGNHRHRDLSFPPGSGCLCGPQNDNFARVRTEQLEEFLLDALTRRGVSNDEAVAQFLELDAFSNAGAPK